MVAGLPSIALAAAPFSPDSSALSVVTVQPLRLSRLPAPSSRLTSAADPQALPLTSDNSSRRTKRTPPAAATVNEKLVLMLRLPSVALMVAM